MVKPRGPGSGTADDKHWFRGVDSQVFDIHLGARLTLSYRNTLYLLAVTVLGCGHGSFEDGFEGPQVLSEAWKVDAHWDCEMRSSGSQSHSGTKSLEIVAPEGARCEIVPRVYSDLESKFRREPFEHSRWYRFSVFVEDLGERRPISDLGDNTIVAQWHSSPDPFFGEKGRGPPLALRILDRTWGITFGWDEEFRSTRRYLARNWHWVGPVEEGRWIDWSFHVIWSYGADGLTQVWKDSELVMDRRGPNVYNDVRGVYLKLGLYHPRSDQQIRIDTVSIADEYSH